MRVGYVRSSPAGLSIEVQRDALAKVRIEGEKLDRVFIDNRPEAILSLRDGDVIAVASASCFGTTVGDILSALVEVSQRGACLLDVSTGEKVSLPSSAFPVLELAQRAESQNKREIAAKARRARAATGQYNQWPGWDDESMRRLQELNAAGTMTREEIACEFGVSRATIQRKLRELAEVDQRES